VIGTRAGLSASQSSRANRSDLTNLLEIAYPVSREAPGASVHPRPVRELDYVASAQGRIGQDTLDQLGIRHDAGGFRILQ
jgi:hypothetical protein